MRCTNPPPRAALQSRISRRSACSILDADGWNRAGYRCSNRTIFWSKGVSSWLLSPVPTLCAGGTCLDDVFNQVLLEFLIPEHLNTTGSNVYRLQPQDVAAADLDLEPKPVGAIEPSRGVEGDRSRDLAFVIVSSAIKKVLPQFLVPSASTDQGFIHEGTQSRNGHGELAQLHHLQQDGNTRQIGYHNSSLAVAGPLQLEV